MEVQFDYCLGFWFMSLLKFCSDPEDDDMHLLLISTFYTSSRSFIVLNSSFRSLTHSELFFVNIIRSGPRSTFSQLFHELFVKEIIFFPLSFLALLSNIGWLCVSPFLCSLFCLFVRVSLIPHCLITALFWVLQLINVGLQPCSFSSISFWLFLVFCLSV